MSRPAKPARSAERQRLAEAIEGYREATTDLDRARQAEEKLFDEILATREEIDAAAKALDEAIAARPQALVSATLGEPAAEGPSASDCEKRLAGLRKKLAEKREARRLVEAEAARVTDAVRMAATALDAATSSAIAADPSVAALKAEFITSACRMLRLAQVLRTAGVSMGAIEAHGLRTWIGDAAAPVGERAFFDDPTWLAAIAALREDADALLPGLPPDDPDEAGDGGEDRVAAA